MLAVIQFGILRLPMMYQTNKGKVKVKFSVLN